MTREGDAFPDSSWRMGGRQGEATEAELDNRQVCYVAIGLVLNQDESWLVLIEEPEGAAFLRDFERGVYVPVE